MNENCAHCGKKLDVTRTAGCEILCVSCELSWWAKFQAVYFALIEKVKK